MRRGEAEAIHKLLRLKPAAWAFVAAACALLVAAAWPQWTRIGSALLQRIADAALVLSFTYALAPRARSAAANARLSQPLPGFVRPLLTGLSLLVGYNLLAALLRGLHGGSDVAVLPPLVGLLAHLAVLLCALRLALRLRALAPAPSRRRPPEVVLARAVAASFAVAVLVGTAALSVDKAHRQPQGLGAIDALFTATSATCVTGLIVLDTPNDFSPLGHAIILVLMQCGGLGIMTLSGAFVLFTGRRISLRHRMVVMNALGADWEQGFVALFRRILLFTLAAEAAGAALLFGHFVREASWGRALWLSVFHAVSAFCNAGFSLFSDSLERYTGSAHVNLVVCALIIVGGIGFPVVQDVYRWVRARGRSQRHVLSLHSRLVLVASGALIAAGMAAIFLLERGGVLAGRPAGEQALACLFQSVTPRTAGFNTLPVGELAPAALVFTVFCMCIGASPASTGGGIKTSTFVVCLWVLGAMVLGSDRVNIAGRSLSEEARHRAVAIAWLLGIGVAVWTLLLCATNSAPLAPNLFEAASAWGTVGLSTGLTPQLGMAGKLLIIVAMFAGRIGPLTLAIAIQRSRRRTVLRYPEEEVIVG